MAVSALYAGSASISTTEYSLTLGLAGSVNTSTEAYTIQPWIDFTNVATGDSFTVKVYEKPSSGGSQRTIETIYVTSSCVLVMPALMMRNGWDITIIRTAGSDRTITWEIRTA